MAELENWEILRGLFPSGWEQLGRTSGAVKRLRGFSSLEALLRTLLMHVGGGWSLRETAVEAKLAGIADVSDVTLLNRLRDAEPWLRQLCEELWKENGVQLQTSFLGRTLRLLDATVVCEPGPTGGQWRIHYSLRLPSLECDYFQLTSTSGAGVAERLGRFQFQANELALGDAGYCHPAGIAAVVEQQADVCVRLNPYALPLMNKDDEPFSLLNALGRLRHSGEQTIAGRICAIRKSRQAIKQAQRRLDIKLQNGKTVAPDTRTYAKYILVFTTLNAQQATAFQVLEAYRLRWQIELTFKRLKSIAQLGHVPKYDDKSSRAWLYGKLLIALLTQKMARIGKTISPWGYLSTEATHPQPLA